MSIARARSLRRRSPPAERLLWSVLRDRRLSGFKFRRQVPIGRYVVDFVCLERRLVVEADGFQHHPARDRERDLFLESQGFTVLRIDNAQMYENLEGAVLLVAAALGLEW